MGFKYRNRARQGQFLFPPGSLRLDGPGAPFQILYHCSAPPNPQGMMGHDKYLRSAEICAGCWDAKTTVLMSFPSDKLQGHVQKLENDQWTSSLQNLLRGSLHFTFQWREEALSKETPRSRGRSMIERSKTRRLGSKRRGSVSTPQTPRNAQRPQPEVGVCCPLVEERAAPGATCWASPTWLPSRKGDVKDPFIPACLLFFFFPFLFSFTLSSLSPLPPSLLSFPMLGMEPRA